MKTQQFCSILVVPIYVLLLGNPAVGATTPTARESLPALPGKSSPLFASTNEVVPQPTPAPAEAPRSASTLESVASPSLPKQRSRFSIFGEIGPGVSLYNYKVIDLDVSPGVFSTVGVSFDLIGGCASIQQRHCFELIANLGIQSYTSFISAAEIPRNPMTLLGLQATLETQLFFGHQRSFAWLIHGGVLYGHSLQIPPDLKMVSDSVSTVVGTGIAYHMKNTGLSLFLRFQTLVRLDNVDFFFPVGFRYRF